MKREEDGGCDFDMMIEGKFLNRRQNMDFTDRLWNVLMSMYNNNNNNNTRFILIAAYKCWLKIHRLTYRSLCSNIHTS